MEEFLTDYVTMHAEAMGIENISKSKISTIVHNLMNDDHVWEELDSSIQNQLQE